MEKWRGGGGSKTPHDIRFLGKSPPPPGAHLRLSVKRQPPATKHSFATSSLSLSFGMAPKPIHVSGKLKFWGGNGTDAAQVTNRLRLHTFVLGLMQTAGGHERAQARNVIELLKPLLAIL